jgi:hypothetical protein
MKRLATVLLVLAVTLAWNAGRGVAEEAKLPTFKGKDTKTLGKWKEKLGKKDEQYGKKAAWIALVTDLAAKQNGYKLAVKDNDTWTWSEDDPGDKRVPQPAKDGEKTPATCWFADESFSLTVTPPETKPYKVTLYVVDYDRGGRAQEVKVEGIDKAEPIVAADCEGGVYLTWQADKPLTIKMNKVDGPNCVVSAVFIDE